jgi:hypothetical protein
MDLRRFTSSDSEAEAGGPFKGSTFPTPGGPATEQEQIKTIPAQAMKAQTACGL